MLAPAVVHMSSVFPPRQMCGVPVAHMAADVSHVTALRRAPPGPAKGHA